MRLSKCLYAALLVSGMAFADEPLDVTIKVVESPNDLPSAVTKTIELPPRAAEIEQQQSARGLDRANETWTLDSGQLELDAVNEAQVVNRELLQGVTDPVNDGVDLSPVPDAPTLPGAPLPDTQPLPEVPIPEVP